MANNYGTALKDPRWQKKRLEIMNRDDFTCLLCSDKETSFNIHHKAYRANTSPWDYEDSNFQTLCEHCHAAVEELKKINATAIICAKSLHETVDNTIILTLVVSNEHARFVKIYIYNLDVKKVIAEIKPGADNDEKFKDLLLLSNKL